jgi:type IV secretory pathway VirB2 component (pilin)
VSQRVETVNERNDQPSFLTMIGLVALIVAVVILVFFGIGYLFGRLFL